MPTYELAPVVGFDRSDPFESHVVSGQELSKGAVPHSL